MISALSALYQMTFAGFFVHLNSIPPVLRWLQWLCPLKYCLEALAVNEVGSGLMIQDTLEGVPVDVSASLIMNLVSNVLIYFDHFSDIWAVVWLFPWGLLSQCLGFVRFYCWVCYFCRFCRLDQSPREALSCVIKCGDFSCTLQYHLHFEARFAAQNRIA